MKKLKGLDCILLIDDDIPTNFIHSRIISKAGIDVEVMSITNVDDALDFLRHTGKYADVADTARPGIIFLDINMPGLTGWDFMEEYHKLNAEHKAQIVVIMLTTSLNPADHDKAIKDPEIASFLHKPLRTEIIAELAGKHFEEII